MKEVLQYNQPSWYVIYISPFNKGEERMQFVPARNAMEAFSKTSPLEKAKKTVNRNAKPFRSEFPEIYPLSHQECKVLGEVVREVNNAGITISTRKGIVSGIVLRKDGERVNLMAIVRERTTKRIV